MSLHHAVGSVSIAAFVGMISFVVEMLNIFHMATKNKTRGPQENKSVKRTDKQAANFQTKKKQTEKEIGEKKK